MYRSQRGISIISFIIFAAVVMVFGYIGLKVGPIYFENGQFVGALKGAREDFHNDPAASQLRGPQLRKYIWDATLRRLVVEGIDDNFDINNFKVDGGLIATYEYNRESQVVSNLYIVGKFKIEMDLQE